MKSADTGAELSFAFPGYYGEMRRDDYLDIDFCSRHLSCQLSVWLHDGDRNSLAALFSEMAEDWRGWKADKKWISAEADLQLICCADRLGHISIEVEFSQQRSSEPWFSTFTVTTEAGQLERLAREAHQVLCIGENV